MKYSNSEKMPEKGDRVRHNRENCIGTVNGIDSITKNIRVVWDAMPFIYSDWYTPSILHLLDYNTTKMPNIKENRAIHFMPGNRVQLIDVKLPDTGTVRIFDPIENIVKVCWDQYPSKEYSYISTKLQYASIPHKQRLPKDAAWFNSGDLSEQIIHYQENQSMHGPQLTLFSIHVILQPQYDNESNIVKEGKILVEPTSILASSTDQARGLAWRAIPEAEITDANLLRIEVVVGGIPRLGN